jgi:inorganic pyrophosphatase
VISAFRPDGSLNVVVESPRGATIKFKYEAAIDRIELSRPLPVGLAYPHDWGFVPSTRASDGDPVDALIAWDGTATRASSFRPGQSACSRLSRRI